MASMISFHRLELRSAARGLDPRFLVADQRRLLREAKGLRHADLLVSGTGPGGLQLPPSARSRCALLWWDHPDCYDRWRAGSHVFQRWLASSREIYSVTLAPYASRGQWSGAPLLDEVSPRRESGGPVGVLTWAQLPAKLVPEWHLRAVPEVAPVITDSKGLLAASGGATPSLRKLVTASFWESAAAMRQAVYARGSAHLSRARWATQREVATSYVRCDVLTHDGAWAGRDPLEGMPAG